MEAEAAELHLEAGRHEEAAQTAFKAMKSAADGLLNSQGLLLSDRYDTVSEFKTRFVEAGKVFPGVADYFLRAAAKDLSRLDPERTRQLVEEANLFTEEAHVVFGRMDGMVIK